MRRQLGQIPWIMCLFGMLAACACLLAPMSQAWAWSGDSVLESAMQAHRTGRFAEAAPLFFDALTLEEDHRGVDSPLDSPEGIFSAKDALAQMYLSHALQQMHLYGASAEIAQSLLLYGLKKRYAAEALELWVESRSGSKDPLRMDQTLGRIFAKESYPKLEEIPGLKANVAQKVAASLARVALRDQNAELYAHGMDYVTQAQAQFVDDTEPDLTLGAELVYLQGLLAIAHQDGGAARAAFKAVDCLVASERVCKLAQLGLARLAYGAGNFTEAKEYYAHIKVQDLYGVEALYERAWASLQMEDHGDALGVVQSFDGPFLQERYAPEMPWIAALVYWEHCQWDRVASSLASYTERYGNIERKLSAWLSNPPAAKEILAAVYEGGEHGLPVEIALHLRRQRPAREGYFALTHLRWEQAYITAQLKQAPAKSAASKMYAWLSKRLAVQHDAFEASLSAWMIGRIQGLIRQLEELQNQVAGLDFERTDAERRWLERGRQIRGVARPKLSRPQIPNDGWQHWPDGYEIWKDELGFVRHVLRSECHGESL